MGRRFVTSFLSGMNVCANALSQDRPYSLIDRLTIDRIEAKVRFTLLDDKPVSNS